MLESPLREAGVDRFGVGQARRSGRFMLSPVGDAGGVYLPAVPVGGDQLVVSILKSLRMGDGALDSSSEGRGESDFTSRRV